MFYRSLQVSLNIESNNSAYTKAPLRQPSTLVMRQGGLKRKMLIIRSTYDTQKSHVRLSQFRPKHQQSRDLTVLSNFKIEPLHLGFNLI